jgi:hypothetical protein
MSIHEDWKDPEAPKPGMSTAVKVLLIVGAIGGLFLLLCCGGIGIVAWKSQDVLKDVVKKLTPTTDAAEIRERLGRITQIDIPTDFEPALGMDLGIMRWVAYEKTPRDGSLFMLFELDRAMLQSATLAEQRREIERMFDQQRGGQNNQFDMQINVTERETRTLTVRGEPVEFDFNKGTSSDGKAMRQVVGAFKTPGGVALLDLIVPEESYNEAAVVTMVESIRNPSPESDADEESNEMMEQDSKTEEQKELPAEEGAREADGSQSN